MCEWVNDDPHAYFRSLLAEGVHLVEVTALPRRKNGKPLRFLYQKDYYELEMRRSPPELVGSIDAEEFGL